MTTTTIGPALPLLVAEHEFLIHDGSMAGAFAGRKLRFVYCKCGETPKAEDWYEHLDRYQGARYLDDGGPHEWLAIERPADYVNDCMLWADDPRPAVYSWWDDDEPPDDSAYDTEAGPTTQQVADSRWHELNEPRNGRG